MAGNLSIKWQFLIICITFVTIPAMVLGYISYSISKQETFREVEEKLSLLVLDWATIAESHIKQSERILAREQVLTEQRLSTIANNVNQMLQIFSARQNTTPEELESLHSQIENIKIGRSGYVFLLDGSGELIVPKGKRIDAKNMLNIPDETGEFIYKKLTDTARKLKEGDSAILYHHLNEYSENNESKQKIIALSYYEPLDTVIGAVSYYTDFKSINLPTILQNEVKDKMAEQKIGGLGYLWVVDTDGNYAVSREKLRNGENIWEEKDSKGGYVIQEIINATQRTSPKKVYIKYYDWKNVGDDKFLDKLSASVYVPEWKWIISASAYHDDFLKGLDKIKRQIILISIISIFAGSIITYFFAYRFIINPVMKLRDASVRISKGDLDIRIDERSKGEIGQLAMAFNKMAMDLKKSLSTLESRQKDLEEKDRIVENINKTLQEANEQLKELDKQKDSFISIAAHELKTPLTSIKGFAQILRNDNLDSNKRKEYLQLINKNSNRLYGLILDLVDSSRISLGQIKIHKEIVDPYKILKDSEETMSVQIVEKGLKPIFTIEKNLPSVNADYERVLQVLRNLLVNSIHYTKEGSVSLGIYKEEDGFIHFAVKDTGEGVPKKNKGDIFSRFYQVDSSMTRKIGGSGLGLSVCKGLVELMGGKIWFESSEGKGTVFYFKLPANG